MTFYSSATHLLAQMAKFNINQKSWMEVAVPAVLMAPNRISVSPQLETIFEEEDSDIYELLLGSGNCIFVPKDLSSLELN
ncbi:uncharacterized protein LOC132058523 [Lycium ferocissimum]|uniref:uncharacterized protein LOC132058523 n=1 Tax=Lycium ferocissimum TaxID=112874 RepID=UPI00281521FE|nr:uncharacterized protein LOC132058523 [Lycium ferocissimum]